MLANVLMPGTRDGDNILVGDCIASGVKGLLLLMSRLAVDKASTVGSE